MSAHNIPIFNIKKENHPKLSKICNCGICSKGPKNEFEPAVVNEPPVFEPFKFYCICFESRTAKAEKRERLGLPFIRCAHDTAGL